MITAERLEAITRFYGLLQTAVAENAEPLTKLQRQVWMGMVGELIEHAKGAVAT